MIVQLKQALAALSLMFAVLAHEAGNLFLEEIVGVQYVTPLTVFEGAGGMLLANRCKSHIALPSNQFLAPQTKLLSENSLWVLRV
jgi:hypothetical protein